MVKPNCLVGTLRAVVSLVYFWGIATPHAVKYMLNSVAQWRRVFFWGGGKRLFVALDQPNKDALFFSMETH